MNTHFVGNSAKLPCRLATSGTPFAIADSVALEASPRDPLRSWTTTSAPVRCTQEILFRYVSGHTDLGRPRRGVDPCRSVRRSPLPLLRPIRVVPESATSPAKPGIDQLCRKLSLVHVSEASTRTRSGTPSASSRRRLPRRRPARIDLGRDVTGSRARSSWPVCSNSRSRMLGGDDDAARVIGHPAAERISLHDRFEPAGPVFIHGRLGRTVCRASSRRRPRVRARMPGRSEFKYASSPLRYASCMKRPPGQDSISATIWACNCESPN